MNKTRRHYNTLFLVLLLLCIMMGICTQEGGQKQTDVKREGDHISVGKIGIAKDGSENPLGQKMLNWSSPALVDSVEGLAQSSCAISFS